MDERIDGHHGRRVWGTISMGRAKAFDEIQAVGTAIRLFWEFGYERTTTRDLADAIGITGSSLFNAFGNKQSLFAAVLEHYVETSTRKRIRRIERRHCAIAAIEAFFDEIINSSASDARRRGCLLVNSAIEIAPQDRAIKEAVAGYLDEIRQFFVRNIALAQAREDKASSHSVEELADALMSALIGVRCTARLGASKQKLRSMAAPMLGLLKNAGGPPTDGGSTSARG